MVGTHEAQAVAALLERADRLLEGLFVGLADAHDLANGAHLRAQFILHTLELLECPACEFEDHVVSASHVFIERAVLAARDLVQRKTGCEHGRDEGDGKARRFRCERR